MLSRVIVAFIMMAPLSANAATYYASPTGSGSTCTSDAPCTVTGGLSKMAPGDMLFLKNGTYTGAVNMIGYYGNQTFPPPGTSVNARTTIKAENVGQAIIDGEYIRCPLYMSDTGNTRNYIHIDGIHFKRGSGGGVFALGGSYNYVSNCGFEDGGPSSDTGQFPIALISEASYTLVEDCWVWGRGRYGIYTSSINGGTNHVIFRRVVVRLDSVPPWVSSGIRFYNASTNTCQNCFVIDGRLDAASEASSFTMGGGSSTSEPNHLWKSCIALNNTGNSNLPGWMAEDMTTQNTWNNSVIWGVPSRGVTTTSASGSGTAYIQNMTIGAASNYEIYNNGTVTFDVSNSLVSTPSGATTFMGINTISNTYYYLASGASSGQAVGTPITLETLNEGLKYLPRIEPGSALKTAGVGANILYQEGITGTYYGQTDWNTTTSNHLWPFANEQMWTAKMAAYTASGPGGNRGFAALANTSATPLTEYIWEYLGNKMPENVYPTGGGGGSGGGCGIAKSSGNEANGVYCLLLLMICILLRKLILSII